MISRSTGRRRAEGRRFFGLDPDRPTLLVTGGSQGARRLNQSVSGAAAALPAPGSRCCTSSARRARRADRATGAPYVVVPFVDRMDLAYAAADLVLCRAGLNSVTEAAAVGLPAVFVPLPIGNGEQAHNARPVVDAGGGLLVDDADLTSEWVAATSRRWPPTRPAGADGGPRRPLIPRDADEQLARIVVEVAGGG